MSRSSVPNLYNEQFSPHLDFAEYNGHVTNFVIASTGRSGSHMVGHALFGTASFGFPLEYLNPVNLTEWRRRFGKDAICDVLVELRRKRTSPNGVFGIKLHWTHFQGIGGRCGLAKYFPDAKILYLYREDKVAQAISLARAMQTGSWIGVQPEVGTAVYDYSLIQACCRRLVREDRMWRKELSRCKNVVMAMRFESFRAQPEAAIRGIAERFSIQLAHEPELASIVTSQQSDDLSRQWAQWYARDRRKLWKRWTTW